MFFSGWVGGLGGYALWHNTLAEDNGEGFCNLNEM